MDSNTILKKDEIKRVLVWVKMHHVPIVAYSEIGLSLISTQIGKPIMLDSYTSNMCLHSWGRSVYARALIEIAANVELVKSLVIAIPLGNKEGHTFAMIDIDDKCPKLPKVVPTDKAADDGFTEVNKKKAKAKQSSKKHVEGIRLNKPPLNLQYRRVDRGESSKQKVNTDVNKVSTNCGPSKTLDKTSKVATTNSFSALSGEDASVWDDDNRVTTKSELHVVKDSDSEDVDEYITIEEGTNSVPKKVSKDQGASTPLEDVSS
ncbi:putative reverse transcriptase domain-containing protein [Tanacetum coccineum]